MKKTTTKQVCAPKSIIEYILSKSQKEMKILCLYGFQSLSWESLMLNNNWSWHSNFQRIPKEFFHSMCLDHNLFYPLTIFLQVFLHSHFLNPLATLQGVCWHWSCLHLHHPISLTLNKAISSIFVFHLPFLINIFEHIILNPWHIMVYHVKENYLKILPSSKKKY